MDFDEPRIPELSWLATVGLAASVVVVVTLTTFLALLDLVALDLLLTLPYASTASEESLTATQLWGVRCYKMKSNDD
jgi:hypothetical protein